MVKKWVIDLSKDSEMSQLQGTDYFLILLTVWVALLSFYLIRAFAYWRKITKDANGQNLIRILETVIHKQDRQEQQMGQLSKTLENLQTIQKGNFSKYALVRFNPFEDTGGDQSFIIALLDGSNNGVVISSLHSRSGTRVYAKEVNAAKPASHQFSKEEKEVVEKACHADRLAARQV